MVVFVAVSEAKFPFTQRLCESDRTMTTKCNGLQRIMRTAKPLRNIEGQ